MRNNIYYSPESRRDMDEIWDYIAWELEDPVAADRVIGRILDTVDQLSVFCEMGTPLSSVADVRSDHRFLTSGNYLVFYRTSGREVYIDRVLYGRRDYLRVLFGDPTDE